MVVWNWRREKVGRTSGHTSAMSSSLVAPSGLTARWTRIWTPSLRRMYTSVRWSPSMTLTTGLPRMVRRSRRAAGRVDWFGGLGAGAVAALVDVLGAAG